jgi:hypothetical protein
MRTRRRCLLLSIGVLACDGATSRARIAPTPPRGSAELAPTAEEPGPTGLHLSYSEERRELTVELEAPVAEAKQLGGDPADAILVVAIGAAASVQPLSALSPTTTSPTAADGRVRRRATVAADAVLGGASQGVVVHACCREWISGAIAISPAV